MQPSGTRQALGLSLVSVTDAFKRVLVGRKLASTQLGETLLPKRVALPIFASDALSSVAYAPDEVLITLSLAGMAGFAFSLPIGIAVGAVLLVVVMSYRQTCLLYTSSEDITLRMSPAADGQANVDHLVNFATRLQRMVAAAGRG